jgi:GH15 family glucan-1,4-alpha-glucosidase
MNLAARSVEVILAGQSPSGGYVACPSFENYRYSWLRDGSFIADAMREAGELESADRFFDWCARVVHARPHGPWDARYTLDGLPDTSDWPKLQTDGPGLYLWALRRRERWDESADLVARWLADHWGEPSVDWWEEREGVHAATLWCIGEGLDSDEIRREARARADDRLDASLLFLDDPELTARVEDALVSPGGGVWRNLDDEYYGGGEWLLLTAMLGLAAPARAEECLAWVEAHARPDGGLPEQAQDHLQRPERYEPWVERWGNPASPLLWSHAMYLRLHHALRGRR